ncbi:MAG TPA: hypothetical protein VFP84_01400, partial [Kofleriaceae bacterium]|nr:hypothetical protein [Kofleriaceae bacterium]
MTPISEPSSDELPIILLIDLATDNAVPEAVVRAQLPPDAPPPHVLRLSEHMYVRPATGTPPSWRSTVTAIERMLQAARDLEPERPR